MSIISFSTPKGAAMSHQCDNLPPPPDLHSLTSHEPFKAHEGQDLATAHTVRLTEKVYAWTLLGLALAGIGLVASAFIANLLRKGFFSGLINALLLFFFLVLLWLGIKKLIDVLIMAPYKAIRYSACAKRMAAALPGYGLQQTLTHQWHLPAPGVLALDSRQSTLFLQTADTDYHRLFLHPGQIVEVKVERESEVHTQTRHSGSIGVFSRAGIGYNFGSKSSSKSVVIERAFLEVHYQQSNQLSPNWIAIPYGENRRDADAMAMAIRRAMLAH
ncbi:MAG: hypothetical protein Q4A28_02875 [Brachymonas sp.]|nr:hypothetical protein [Brachymonas sp.]